ncbi:LEAF RUST 10 DISEASE-RESISTANCE LOCUS RECEPTOR-LIKE PROTEIN [Drosera capensis]
MTFSGTKTRIKAVFWPLFIFALCQILGLSAVGEAVGNNGLISLSSLELQCYPYDENSGELGCGYCVFNCSIPLQVKNCEHNEISITAQRKILIPILSTSQVETKVARELRICNSSYDFEDTYPHCVNLVNLQHYTWYRCDEEINTSPSDGVKDYQCGSSHVYGYEWNGDAGSSKAPARRTSMHNGCSIIPFPPPQQTGIQLHYHLTGNCSTRITESEEFKAEWGIYDPRNLKRKKGSIIIVLALSAAYCHYQYRFSLQPKRLDSTKPDLEDGGVCYGFPMIFNYSELSEATDNFDSSRVLGDGGFGIVYHGKLRDGREVAVKRLYERNYNHEQQFKNEVDVLTCLRHPNLVILYGCTSRHSRELLLIYEYIPNGTVADHLHGEWASLRSLTWPLRMKIAIETASALSYLHASDIIHCDVKTNNILLDNNFCVKVADFGLSRLFPMDVSHISTAPQGTPGYLDPEYQKCYQLTKKCDVYSFGVVLVELISSLSAVDIFRPADEINLSDYALTRIESRAFHELIDPELGFESDSKVRRMTIQVAELAFQCLQQKKEFRPSMNVVLETLENINNADYEEAETEEMNKNGKPEDEESVLSLSEGHSEAALLKNNQSNSPNSVMENFVSRSYTSSTST